MNLLVQGLQTSVQVPAVQFNLGQVLLGLVALLPIVGGYLLAREGRGNLLLDVLAVILLVLATVIPFQPVSTLSLQTILADFISRWPLMVFLLGIAFVRDGGWKIVLGVILMAVSGLILIPQV